MSYFYFDSSALAKRYLTEIGSRWVNQITDPLAGHSILIAEITQVEVAAALAARHRASRGISRQVRDMAVNLLAYHTQTEYHLIALSPIILDRAVDLTQKHRLRGYDAIQLATALETELALSAAQLPGLIFVTADSDLLSAAQLENLLVENPNGIPN